jgi:hypothetical protein
MALTVDLTETAIGTPLGGCYLRIVRLGGDKDTLRVSVEAYANEQARRDGKMPILIHTHVVTATEVAGPLFPALYAHLKTLPEYAGAVDC